MTRVAALLILSSAAGVALAQNPLESLFRGRSNSQQMQIQGGMQMQMPTREEMEQMQRDAAEMQRLHTEIQRLQRVGRYDEAQALSRRLDEIMQSGPTGRMLNQQRAMRELRRALPPGTLPEGVELEDLDQVMPRTADLVGMERSMMEGDGAFLPEPLFVRPSMLHYLPESVGQAMRIPPAARRHLMAANQRVIAKDYAGAEASIREALALSRAPQIVESAARIEWMRGNGPGALGLLQEAIDVLARDNPRNSAIAGMLWTQAVIYNATGAPRRAVEVCERALGVAAARGQATVEYGAGLNNLGAALHEAGLPARALPNYQKAYAVLEAALSGASQMDASIVQSQLPNVSSNIGLARWQLGDAPGAAHAWLAALDGRAYLEQANMAFMTERAQLAKAQAVAVELHALVSLERAAASGSLGLQTLLERKGALLERQTRVQAAFRRDANAQVEQPGAVGRLFEGPTARMQRESASQQRAQDQDLLREYQAVVQERAATPRTPENAARIRDLDMRIQVMQQRMQMHEQQTRNQDVQLTHADMQAIARQSRNDPQRMTDAINARMQQQQQTREQAAREARASLLGRVQERVPPGAVLLEMVKYRPLDPGAGLADEKRWGAERYGVYVIAAQGEPQYLDYGPTAPIDALVREFRGALANPERLKGRELGRQLDEILMKPVRARAGDARTIYVAPEGSLNLAPLSALVDEQGRYLLERYTFNYLASGRDLLVLGRGEAPRGPALVMADPAFDETGGAAQGGDAAATRSRDFRDSKFKRLPGTAVEAQTLKRVLPDAAVVTGPAATETAAKGVAGPRILHIATHGFFLEDVPGESEDPMLRSGLVFAGVNALRSGQDDGVLTALEASNLDLRGTKLVVLSACETGLGEVRNGEGVFGLRRAFTVAGAETLLMSLWQVADEATKDLMVAYYGRLAGGEPRAEALRQAQLALLKDDKTAHPFFWAAFISAGEAGALK